MNEYIDNYDISYKTCHEFRWCLDPLLKSDFTDFYAQNAFCKKSEVFGWDFENAKYILPIMHFVNSHFQSRNQNPKYFRF